VARLSTAGHRPLATDTNQQISMAVLGQGHPHRLMVVALDGRFLPRRCSQLVRVAQPILSQMISPSAFRSLKILMMSLGLNRILVVVDTTIATRTLSPKPL